MAYGVQTQGVTTSEDQMTYRLPTVCALFKTTNSHR